MAVAGGTDGQVRGVTVQVSIDGVMSVFQSRMRDILDDHGIEKPDPRPDEWYPLEKFIQVLEVVETDVGENALAKVGEATPRFAEFSTDPDAPAEALQHVADVFEDNHRNVTGDYTFERTGETSGRIVSTTPYPETWEGGLLKGTAEQHGSTYARVSVASESEDETVFEIEW